MRRAVVLALLTACGAKSPHEPRNAQTKVAADPGPAPVRSCIANTDDEAANNECTASQLDVFKMKMCTCLDRTCADTVNELMMKWSKAAADAPRPTGARMRMDPEVTKRISASTTMYGECYTRIVMQQATPPAPANPCSP
ncbi:MAG: hypothetical protein ABI867_09395 [Kofleriaceae bacterium]